VARRHDINANLLFKWKRLEEAGEPDRLWLLGPEFVPIGVVGRADDGQPALLARMPGVADGQRQNGSGEPQGPSGLESRAGVIQIGLPDGARIRVDPRALATDLDFAA
jgi:hypothetical protein